MCSLYDSLCRLVSLSITLSSTSVMWTLYSYYVFLIFSPQLAHARKRSNAFGLDAPLHSSFVLGYARNLVSEALVQVITNGYLL